MSVTPTMEMAAMTHVGLAREHNEDAVGYDLALGLAVVADGVGGRHWGEVASRLAVDRITSGLRQSLHARSRSAPEARDWVPTPSLLQATVHRTNSAIYRSRCDGTDNDRMATTLVAALFEHDRVTVAHVGDSRLYRLRDNQLSKLTSDHSLMQELIQKGYLTVEQANTSRYQHMLTRALGAASEVAAELGEHPTHPGDLYLLCSDGLTNVVSDADLNHTMQSSSRSLVELSQQLVDLANARGGPDNISVVLVRLA